MVSVRFCKFAKKPNSTASPAGVTTYIYSCTIKGPCSLLSPVLEVVIKKSVGDTEDDLLSCNYAIINDFGRQYFITDWVYIGANVWQANLAVDVLGSNKSGIYSTECYVARASKTFDPYITDGYYPAKARNKSSKNSYWPQVVGNPYSNNSPWQSDYSAGFYIVGIINNDSTAIGGVSYYAFTSAQFNTFKSILLGDWDWTGEPDDVSEELYKSLFNPYQYITGVNWIPIDPLTPRAITGIAISTLKFGWWELSVSCTKLTKLSYTFSGGLQVFAHPQEERGYYLNAAPYTEYRLIAPPWGEFTLDNSLLLSSTWITPGQGERFTNVAIVIDMDYVSGQGDMYAYALPTPNSTEMMLLVHSQTAVSVPVQIAQVTSNQWGQVRNTHEMQWNTASALGKTLGSAFALDIGGVIGGAMDAAKTYDTYVLNGIENKVPHVQERGNNGSITGFHLQFYLECDYQEMVDDDNPTRGRPYCKNVFLSTLAPGYVQTVDAHFTDDEITEKEVSMINNFLNGGVFLE